MLTTTLNRIRAHSPCGIAPREEPKRGLQKLLAYLGKTTTDDEPLPYAVILASNGLDDALWCCRAEPQYSREWRLFAVGEARSVQYLMTDPRGIAAIDVAERHANGQATDAELTSAGASAGAAAGDAAWDTARAAAWDAARDAARAAAWDAAWAAARDAAWAAAWDTARDAAGAAARDAARDAAGAAAAKRFLAIVGE